MHVYRNKSTMWILFVSGFVVITCYPTGKPTQYRDLREEKVLEAEIGKPAAGAEPELRDEKQFPNGTVVGKYTYLDKEGNPIQVKYYADEQSYGVELKSIKVLDTNVNRAENSPTFSKESYDSLKELTSKMPDPRLLPDPYRTVFPPIPKLRNSDPFEYLGNEVNKVNRYKHAKASSDFEVYYQNELKGPRKCGKEKFRVYYDKERKTRNVINNNIDSVKYCEKF